VPKSGEAGAAASVDTHVLEGPQTAETALKQDDVDDLLASLGFQVFQGFRPTAIPSSGAQCRLPCTRGLAGQILP